MCCSMATQSLSPPGEVASTFSKHTDVLTLTGGLQAENRQFSDAVAMSVAPAAYR